jgi:hypothetical protein
VVMTCKTYKTPSFVTLVLNFSGFKCNSRIVWCSSGISICTHYRARRSQISTSINLYANVKHNLFPEPLLVYSRYRYSSLHNDGGCVKRMMRLELLNYDDVIKRDILSCEYLIIITLYLLRINR